MAASIFFEERRLRHLKEMKDVWSRGEGLRLKKEIAATTKGWN